MRLYTIALSLFVFVGLMAKEDIGTKDANDRRSERSDLAMKFGSDCEPASQSADLDVNNVRTKILNGGDMWWDLNNARYEIPKIEDLNSVRKNSLFSGAIWIGGEDLAQNLRLAAMTYRQRGSDFWPGPLDPNTGNIDAATCERWDKIFKVDGQTIIDHVAKNGSGTVDPQIRDWPAEVGAPYKDVNNSGDYDPENGDYPILRDQCAGLDIDNLAEDQPDQMLWWIYNDNGNIHSETQGDPIGVEMQTTAFAFATNDEINDMTFYTTRIINRGASELVNTYFGQWVDADLGNFSDDYVGCDVGLSLGFCYNGDDNDEGVLGYGLNPPSVGVDFFEGPTAENEFGELEELGLSKFVYYNNDADPINGNPRFAQDFYNYLRGRWMNGADIEFGGDGITGTDGTVANYMFPFDTDPDHPNQNWNEREAGNAPADRRFIQSSGPFELQPGAVQRLTVGVVWARAPFGGAEGSLELLKLASRKAQQLFNSCFDLIDGPNAPDVEIHEQDQQIVLSLGGTKPIEEYIDTVIDGEQNIDLYSFQGYRLFQLKDGSVSLSELTDASKAREVFQCDIEDGFSRLINGEFAPDVGANIPVLKVDGNNEGLVHTIRLTEDVFATGSNKTLVNFKDYYYILLSYAVSGTSDLTPYLEGRKVQKFSASPHKLEPKFGGSSVSTFYGDGPELEVIAGIGNGNNILELKEDVKLKILEDGSVTNPIYENGMGPVKISVIDPLKIPKGDFELSMIPYNTTTGTDDDSLYADSTTWILVKSPNDTVFADTTINYRNEQIILESTTGNSIYDWGLAVTIEQVSEPGARSRFVPDNGLLDWSVEFSDPSVQWLDAVRDQDVSAAGAFGVFDWIRSGTQGSAEQFNDPSWHDFSSTDAGALDRNGVYEGIWDGRIAPARLVSNTNAALAPGRNATLVQPFTYGYQAMQGLGMENLSSVDIIITPDESKWSECIVIEMGEDPGLNEGGAEKFDMRTGVLDWDGPALKQGKTIFPGYAINVGTGERLNIMIGEDSYLRGDNGRDMKWNPTSNQGVTAGLYPILGGRHFIYVMGSHTGIAESVHPELPIYDRGAAYHQIFTEASTLTGSRKLRELTKIYQNCDWIIPSYLAFGQDELIENPSGIPVPPNEVTIKLRVADTYGRNTDISENDGLPKYKFNTDDIFNDINEENGKDALDLVNVVPNPYYAFSAYETSPIDNRIKFTNLPPSCEISIYTLDGMLVRRIKKDDPTTESDWNLKNTAGVPIASGMYIIHIDADELGEKVLKWMGVMRELDLDSF